MTVTRPDGGVVLLQLSKAELLQMKMGSGRDSRSVSTGELLPAGNLVGTGKTTVHKAASGLRGPQDSEDGSATRSPLHAAECRRRGLPSEGCASLTWDSRGSWRRGRRGAFRVQWPGGTEGSEYSQSRALFEAGAQAAVWR